ncbi:Crp/Fnr family transcriptional regulator [Pleomorphomonas sp. JP5]|uniref:Crp/Fnr family transcriptional regulator n=1 Tax=Pleomorphomonas sp. JP5 TaxID=2942998 RepID=UPI00204441FE|nr:cyclic nucleotide-binding domain-containing protein [Pleomorphomonas sp. JP5]MCM5559771.1 cyclic nucleotide-binding domain-containing protein [Pleomorphomonas sp. JP5]
MSLESDIKLLGTVSMLSDFTEDKLRLLAFSAENRDFRDGQRLYSAGDRADCAHVISSGEVALFSPGDSETAAEVIGRGALLGGLALIVDGERTMTAVARGRVETILIRRPLFRRMLDEFPEIAANLHRRLSANVRETTSRLMTVRDRLDRLGN